MSGKWSAAVLPPNSPPSYERSQAMSQRSVQDHSARHENFSRRNFLAGTTAAAAGLLIVEPRQVAAAEANSKITLGLIGCGGRGNWIANLFQQHGGYQFVATADYFPDRAAAAAQRLGVAENQAFSGLSGYKRLLDARPDAIVIESPPYFHAEQAMAGVDAGCHVYCAKPIAVDVPGCLTIAEAGRKGTEKKRVVLIDFQTRTSEFYQEAVRRVHAGDIGNVVSGEAVYYGGQLWGSGYDPNNPESRIRAWGLDRILSGDTITEQFIHALDVATWIVDAAPVKAYGACGKNGRNDAGTCNDHFNVIYSFPKDVLLSFTGTQFGTRLRRHRLPHVRPARNGRHALFRHRAHCRPEVVQGRHARESLRRRGDQQHRRVPRGDRQGRLRQRHRGAQRAEQSDHDPRPHGGLQEGRSHLGRDDQGGRKARVLDGRAEELRGYLKRREKPVGWEERSESHHESLPENWWDSLRSSHPTCVGREWKDFRAPPTLHE